MKVRRSKKVLENFVCPNCWNQVHKCTCAAYPPWTLIMIDLNMQEIIRILNEKHYQTIGCCESHYKDSYSLYVAFAYDLGFDVIPDGFSYSKSRAILSYQFKTREMEDKESYERIKAVKLKALLGWAQSLPEFRRTGR